LAEQDSRRENGRDILSNAMEGRRQEEPLRPNLKEVET